MQMGELSLGEEGGKKLEISSQIFIHEREREFKVVVECGERVGGGRERGKEMQRDPWEINA